MILTTDQLKCVNYAGGDLLVKGVAGSGKTLVLLKRASKLMKDAEKENKKLNMGIFTYAKTLSLYSNEMMEGHGENHNLQIKTFHSWALGVLRGIGIRFSIMNNKTTIDQKEAIKKALRRCNLNESKRLSELPEEFWVDEISWIKGKLIKSADIYIKSDRKGRGAGIRMSQKEKELSFQIYSAYEAVLKENNLHDWDDAAILLLNNYDKIPEHLKFDYTFIDEAQDLTAAQLIIIKRVTKTCIAIGADPAQKIYKTSFTWKEVGIDIRGQASKKLNKNFRSTKQITLFAHSLLQKDNLVKTEDEDYTVPEIPDIEGPNPYIFLCSSTQVEDAAIIAQLKISIKESMSTAILCHTWKEEKAITSLLINHNLKYDIINRNMNGKILTLGIKIVSMHSAKGLEFDTVIIPRFNKGVIPLEASAIEKEDFEEFIQKERRLLYVAMTRAKKELYIFGQANNISPFFEELDENLCEIKSI